MTTAAETFADFDVHPQIVEALAAAGILHPFPIQAMTLPVALGGHDIIGQAKTGTGKTLGFGLPLLERVVVPVDVEAGRARPEDLVDGPQALIIVPTRELCTQVSNDLLTAGKVAIAEPVWQAYSTEVYLVLAAIYFIFCYVMARYSRGIESELSRTVRR